MRKCVFICLMVSAILISSTLCFGNEDKDHICFRKIDADKDGIVTFQEFKKVFGDDKAKYDKIDLNCDGKLIHDEYHVSICHGAP